MNALKIFLFFTKDKIFNNDLLKANFIFRLVRIYKKGIDEIDVVIVKILYYMIYLMMKVSVKYFFKIMLY